MYLLRETFDIFHIKFNYCYYVRLLVAGDRLYYGNINKEFNNFSEIKLTFTLH